jgi:hypothetical protein
MSGTVWRSRPWLWPLLAVTLVLASLSLRATWEQRAAYVRAVQLERQGDLWRAVDEYRWTLRWYTPWGPDTADAAAALRDLARRHAAADPELAVQAWDNLRSGLIASRHLWQPRAGLVAEANEALPPLLLRVAERRGDLRDKTQLLRHFQAAYARPVGVGPWTSLAVSAGFVAWLAGLGLAVARGLDSEGRWSRAGLRPLGLSLAGFAVWMAALWWAG